MASAIVPFIIGENLETFSLLWLDAEVNESSENVAAQQQLRTSINYLKTFAKMRKNAKTIFDRFPKMIELFSLPVND